MQPGQKIEIQLADELGRRVRLANVLPTITFFLGGHRRYVFDLAPTGADGRTLVGFDELNTRRLEAGLTSLMDFNDSLTCLDAEVEISISSESELRERVRGMDEWNHWTRPTWILKWPVNGCLAAVEPKQAVLVERSRMLTSSSACHYSEAASSRAYSCFGAIYLGFAGG